MVYTVEAAITDVCVVNADGSGKTRLTDHPASDDDRKIGAKAPRLS